MISGPKLMLHVKEDEHLVMANSSTSVMDKITQNVHLVRLEHVFIMKPSGSELTPKVREVSEVFVESGDPRGQIFMCSAKLSLNAYIYSLHSPF
jgi:hypothetical protein